MRALLERSRSARAAVAAVAVISVLCLARAASAGDDPGLRLDTLWTVFQPPQPPVARPAPAPIPVQRRRARRIWAASRSRPLRITLARRSPRPRVAAARGAHVGARPAGVRVAADPQVVFPKLIVLPKPPRPALVSIYQDRTLRDGDAVMMADGIHVFRGWGEWPHRPRDFVRLTFVAALDWRLRQTLDALDRNPPTRWSSTGSVSG